MLALAEFLRSTVILAKSTVEPLISAIFDLLGFFNEEAVMLKPRGDGETTLFISPLGLFKVFPLVNFLFVYPYYFCSETRKGRGLEQPGVVIPLTGIIYSGSIFERRPDF